MRTMKELIKILGCKDEQFSAKEWLVYGVGYPCLVVVGCLIFG